MPLNRAADHAPVGVHDVAGLTLARLTDSYVGASAGVWLDDFKPLGGAVWPHAGDEGGAIGARRINGDHATGVIDIVLAMDQVTHIATFEHGHQQRIESGMALGDVRSAQDRA